MAELLNVAPQIVPNHLKAIGKIHKRGKWTTQKLYDRQTKNQL